MTTTAPDTIEPDTLAQDEYDAAYHEGYLAGYADAELDAWLEEDEWGDWGMTPDTFTFEVPNAPEDSDENWFPIDGKFEEE